MSNLHKKNTNMHNNESSIEANQNAASRLNSRRKKRRSSCNEMEITNSSQKQLTPSTSENYYERFAFDFFNQSTEHLRTRSNLVREITEIEGSGSSTDDENTSKNTPPCKKTRIKANHNKINMSGEVPILEMNCKETTNIANNSVHAGSSSNIAHVISNERDVEVEPLENNCLYADCSSKPFNETKDVATSSYSKQKVWQCTQLQDSSEEDKDVEFNFLKYYTNEIVQENQNEFRVILYRDAIVYFHGLISIRVLQGSIDILGCILDASNETYNIYSPAGSSLLAIFNCTTISSTDIAIVLCSKLDSQLYRSLSLYGPKNMFPTLQDNGTYCIVNASSFFENFSLYKPSPKWEPFASALTSKCRVVIAGNKGTGKSTLLRYLVNQLLCKDASNSTQAKILVVDLDPGQPEFTPPGCISIVMVKSPLLGPSYTHQQMPEKCIHISNIDIKYNMDEYIRSCKYLLSTLEEYPNIPILVNYIGYSKGLGQELISTIISFVNPTNVVQLNDPDLKHNFRKDLSIDNVKDDAKWIPDSEEEIDLSFELVQFETVHSYNKLNSLIYTPGQFRDIAIVSYFSTLLKGDPLCLTDLEVKIYSAALDKIKIRDAMGNSHPAICNANLVSLCRRVSLENKEIFNCLGWGVVRCVSISRNMIYLLSPLKIELFENTEYLLVSSVRLPLAMYITTAKDISGQIPYIEGGQQTDLEKPSKRQHYNWEKANQ